MSRRIGLVAALLALAAIVIVAANRGATPWTAAAEPDASASHETGRLLRSTDGGAEGPRASLKKTARTVTAKKTDGEGTAEPKETPEPASAARAGDALKAHVVVLARSAPIEELRASEALVRETLAALEPLEVVALLRKTEAPAAFDLVVRWLDRRLAEDRPTWEDALFLGMEEANRDADGLAVVAEIAEPRMEAPDVRAAAAHFLEKRATTSRLQRVLERFRPKAGADAARR